MIAVDAPPELFFPDGLWARLNGADPLRALPNVLLTPHEAGGTLEARRRAGEIVLAEIARFLAGQPLEHEVTPASMARMG